MLPSTQMSASQLAQVVETLRASSDPSIVAALAARTDDILVNYLNGTSSPAFTVWKSSVSRMEASVNMDWTRVDNLSVGKARIWDWMFQVDRIEPSDPTIQAGINAVWVGTAADLAVRATVYANCKRIAKRVERILASGVGSDVSPGVLLFEGSIEKQELSIALNQP